MQLRPYRILGACALLLVAAAIAALAIGFWQSERQSSVSHNASVSLPELKRPEIAVIPIPSEPRPYTPGGIRVETPSNTSALTGDRGTVAANAPRDSGGASTPLPPTAAAPPPQIARQESTAASAASAAMDESVVEAEVARRAKPADVKFEIETKMAMGQVYEAKLEILRLGGGRQTLITGSPEINERVQILNKARATISSAHLKIERLLPEWQEIPTGGRGLWTWKVEPQKPGKTQLLVLVEHAGTFDNKERVFNVEQFPRTIEIEVGFWQSIHEAIAGVSPSIAAIGTIVAALAGIAGAVAGGWAWLRNRRRETGGDKDDSHGVTAT
jgi:hypothetical protein